MSGAMGHELHERRRGRNLAVGGILLALVALIFAVSVVKLQTNAARNAEAKSAVTTNGGAER